MGKPIGLFSGYTGKENRITNYCLLVLKMLYEESPKFLAEALSGLIDYDISDHIGAIFRQQEKRHKTIPDGLITQKSFTVYIETKNSDCFRDEQLENYLLALNKEAEGLKVLIALGKVEDLDERRFNDIRKVCEQNYRNTILFAAVSFEDFVEALKIEHLSKNLLDTIMELRNHLDEEELLPAWQNWLDVVNCARLPEDVIEKNVYRCPAEGGAYSHRRCKYFGMYRNKCVEKIALIKAVVDVESTDNARVLWKNVPEESEEFLKNVAKEKVALLKPDTDPTRIFLLDQLYPTDFRKDTSGGMRGNKQYFDISVLKPEDAEELARALTGRTWSSL